MGDSDDHSTTSDLPSEPRSHFERRATRAGLLLLVLIVLAGAVGLLGPRKGTSSASASGYRLDVTYPAITRAGEPAPLHIRVHSTAGFDGPVHLALCDDLFDHLDFQNWYPNPSDEAGEPDRLVYEFDEPDGRVFETSLDARAAPGEFGDVADCAVAVLRDDTEVVSVSFHTWRMP